MAAGILTLTTDFGRDGPYVASMKGIILGLAPGTQIVDVSHAIAPQDVAEGSFVLAEIVDSFPAGTVHLAVVDPGVGTARRLVVVEVRDHWFVLPDNGLISEVLRGAPPQGAWEIENPGLRRAVMSATFHGRDILAPAAAHLLRGGNAGELGPPAARLVTFPTNEPTRNGTGLSGEVIYVDAFGNLITNIRREHLGQDHPSDWTVEILGQKIQGMVRTYGESQDGDLVALIGSSERLEVAQVNGNAANNLQAAPGTVVRLHRRPEPIA